MSSSAGAPFLVGSVLAALLVMPFALGAYSWSQRAESEHAAQTTFAPLRAGDKGAATLGASQASAVVTVSDLAIQIRDDVLKMSIEDQAWQVRAAYVSHTGFTGLLTGLTVTLASSAGSEDAIRISNGQPTITVSDPLSPAQGSTVELRAAASLGAAGTLHLDLVFTQGGVEVRQAVTLHVT